MKYWARRLLDPLLCSVCSSRTTIDLNLMLLTYQLATLAAMAEMASLSCTVLQLPAVAQRTA